ncbi:MAG: hypothetical protein NZ529_03120 [Cytophagaceae bacterium]|nr:hypothetical protein [Cytophagaceae bacterium]MDW8455761.1 hypothetical protein [Cytophagaceae bacterium]
MAQKVTKPEDPKKSGNNRGLLIAFIIILFAINVIQLFFNLKQNSEIKQQKATINDGKKRIDSLTTELNKAIEDLKAKKEEIAKLQGDTTELGAKIRELEAARDQALRSAANYRTKYENIQSQIDAANRIRERAMAEVEKYKAMLEEKEKQIIAQKQTIVAREDSISKILQQKNILEDKVQKASKLAAYDFKIVALSPKGKPLSGDEFKAKKVDKLKITFTLGENEVAEKGGREIFLRIIEPDGASLFDLSTGGGSFQYDGKEIFYAMKQKVLFDNKKQPVSFEYKKGSSYKPGQHRVEIYTEGTKIGEAVFKIKK